MIKRVSNIVWSLLDRKYKGLTSPGSLEQKRAFGIILHKQNVLWHGWTKAWAVFFQQSRIYISCQLVMIMMMTIMIKSRKIPKRMSYIPIFAPESHKKTRRQNSVTFRRNMFLKRNISTWGGLWSVCSNIKVLVEKLREW